MSLEELNEKIHNPNFELGEKHETLPYTPETLAKGSVSPHAPTDPRKEWTPLRSSQEETIHIVPVDPKQARRKKFLLIFGGLALLLLLGGVIFKIETMRFAVSKVSLSMTGPKDIKSNTKTTFILAYENKNSTNLENASLIVNYPSSFHPEMGTDWKGSGAQVTLALGTIAPGAQKKVELPGSFSSSEKQLGVFQTRLHFSPAGEKNELDITSEWSLSIGSSPLVLNVDGPVGVGNGQIVEYRIEYRNESQETFDGMRLILDYPAGFHFKSSDPVPSEGDHIWYVGNITIRGTGTFTIRGVMSGSQDEVKSLALHLGKMTPDGNFLSFAEGEKITRIIASPLSISQTVNGLPEASVLAGQVLHYNITFKNNGDIGLRNLILSIDLDPTYLYMKGLDLLHGTYNASQKQIVFRASDMPELARLEPGQGGEVKFSVPVKDDIPEAASHGKNITIETTARIDSPDVPTPIGANKVVASNVTQVKVLSEESLNVNGYYYDTAMPNTGPIPPQVGQETTYTFHVGLSSTLNAITDTKVVIALPSNVRYIGTRSPESETTSFSSRSGELVWTVGTLSAGEEGNRELIFQVGITPDTSLVGKVPRLINSAVMSGKDNFVDQDVHLERKEKTTQLTEDKNLTFGSGTVAPAP